MAGEEEQHWVKRSAKPRWVIAVLVAVAATIYFYAATTRDSICHQVLSGGSTHTLCTTPDAVQLIPAALIIALLLFPDLSELGIVGLISLKRTVDQAVQGQDRLERQLLRVEQQVDNSNTINITNVVREARDGFGSAEYIFDVLAESEDRQSRSPAPPRDDSPAALPVREPESPAAQEPERPTTPAEPPHDDRPQVESTEPSTTRPETGPSTNDPFMAIFGPGRGTQPGADPTAQPEEAPKDEFMRLSRNLETYQHVTQERQRGGARRPQMAHLTEEQQKLSDLFFFVFSDEVQAVMAVRNALVHDPDSVTPEAIDDGRDVARRLVTILLQRLGLNGPQTTSE